MPIPDWLASKMCLPEMRLPRDCRDSLLAIRPNAVHVPHALRRATIVVVAVLCISCSSLPGSPVRSPPPEVFRSQTPEPPLPATHLPAPTTAPVVTAPLLPPTPCQTLDHARVISDVMRASNLAARHARAEPLCLEAGDTDGDGRMEWVGTYLSQAGDGQRLEAFIIDDGQWFDLLPLEKSRFGLGEYAACEIELLDANVDGRLDILTWGHAGSSTDLLHVFTWDGIEYPLLAAFEGPAGVYLDAKNGGEAPDIVVRYRSSANLAWEAVYTWDGSNYGWTWERYDWYHSRRPHAYQATTPENAVISFYLALNDRDLPAAYELLSRQRKDTTPADEWFSGYSSTVAVEAGSVHEVSRSPKQAVITALVKSYDNESGRIVGRLWSSRWTCIRADGEWRLDEADQDLLQSWEASDFR